MWREQGIKGWSWRGRSADTSLWTIEQNDQRTRRVIMACELCCCLLPECEALRICRSGFPIATIVLTYDNQSILSSFSLFLYFVTISSVAEKAFSGSTDLGLIVIKAWNSFFRLFDLFFVASKRLISFFTICDRISSCSGIVLWSPLSRITWILCFDFKWLIKLSVFEPPTFVSRSMNCALLLVEHCFIRNGSKLLIFFDY